VNIAVAGAAPVGEVPNWDERTGTLHYLDAVDHLVSRLRGAPMRLASITSRSSPGMIPRRNGGLALARRRPQSQ
jgi:hypothetical protein